MILIIITIVAFFVIRKATRKLLFSSVCHAVDTTAWSGFRASQEVRNFLGGEKQFQEDVKRLLEESETNHNRGRGKWTK